MELYFKDLEEEAGFAAAGGDHACDVTDTSCETAEEDAFAELSERVSAARLIY